MYIYTYIFYIYIYIYIYIYLYIYIYIHIYNNNNNNNKSSLLAQSKETIHVCKYQKDKTDGRGSTAYNRLINYYIGNR